MGLASAYFVILILACKISNGQVLTVDLYDFIIVGGGTAGNVVVNRLSESDVYSVLLLEAGGIPPEFLNVPAFAFKNADNPDYTFQYESVPQKNAALGINRGVIKIPLGRVIGGTSCINHMIFNRGHANDFDNWANFTNDPSWKYENMLEFFKKSETYLGEFPSESEHGRSGPITVSYQKYAPAREPWEAAAKETGFQVRDSNGPQMIGFAPMEFAKKFGSRRSSYEGYLKPIENRSNLRIITYAYATKVIFNLEGNKAAAVEYNINGSSLMAFASRKIILSAGSYNSAAFLQRSGIGPKAVLQSARIPLMKELPVGENLMEHPITPIHIVLNNKSLVFDEERDLTEENHKLYENKGEGPYTTTIGFSGQGFFAFSVAVKDGWRDWPDYQLVLAADSSREEQFKNYYLAPWETSIKMILYLARGKSRGSVTINPEDIYGNPVIDFNYFGDKRDVKTILDAIQNTIKIFERTRAWQRYGARPLHACAHLPVRSEIYWRCYIRQVTLPGNHPSGTCAMGSVVDSKLKVYGIKGLRVVDASIMPFINDSNLHAAIRRQMIF